MQRTLVATLAVFVHVLDGTTTAEAASGPRRRSRSAKRKRHSPTHGAAPGGLHLQRNASVATEDSDELLETRVAQLLKRARSHGAAVEDDSEITTTTVFADDSEDGPVGREEDDIAGAISSITTADQHSTDAGAAAPAIDLDAKNPNVVTRQYTLRDSVPISGDLEFGVQSVFALLKNIKKVVEEATTLTPEERLEKLLQLRLRVKERGFNLQSKVLDLRQIVLEHHAEAASLSNQHQKLDALISNFDFEDWSDLLFVFQSRFFLSYFRVLFFNALTSKFYEDFFPVNSEGLSKLGFLYKKAVAFLPQRMLRKRVENAKRASTDIDYLDEDQEQEEEKFRYPPDLTYLIRGCRSYEGPKAYLAPENVVGEVEKHAVKSNRRCLKYRHEQLEKISQGWFQETTVTRAVEGREQKLEFAKGLRILKDIEAVEKQHAHVVETGGRPEQNYQEEGRGVDEASSTSSSFSGGIRSGNSGKGKGKGRYDSNRGVLSSPSPHNFLDHIHFDEVDPTSLRSGNVITRLNDEPVSSIDGFLAALKHAVAAGGDVRFSVDTSARRKIEELGRSTSSSASGGGAGAGKGDVVDRGVLGKLPVTVADVVLGKEKDDTRAGDITGADASTRVGPCFELVFKGGNNVKLMQIAMLNLLSEDGLKSRATASPPSPGNDTRATIFNDPLPATKPLRGILKNVSKVGGPESEAPSTGPSAAGATPSVTPSLYDLVAPPPATQAALEQDFQNLKNKYRPSDWSDLDFSVNLDRTKPECAAFRSDTVHDVVMRRLSDEIFKGLIELLSVGEEPEDLVGKGALAAGTANGVEGEGTGRAEAVLVKTESNETAAAGGQGVVLDKEMAAYAREVRNWIVERQGALGEFLNAKVEQEMKKVRKMLNEIVAKEKREKKRLKIDGDGTEPPHTGGGEAQEEDEIDVEVEHGLQEDHDVVAVGEAPAVTHTLAAGAASPLASASVEHHYPLERHANLLRHFLKKFHITGVVPSASRPFIVELPPPEMKKLRSPPSTSTTTPFSTSSSRKRERPVSPVPSPQETTSWPRRGKGKGSDSKYEKYTTSGEQDGGDAAPAGRGDLDEVRRVCQGGKGSSGKGRLLAQMLGRSTSSSTGGRGTSQDNICTVFKRSGSCSHAHHGSPFCLASGSTSTAETSPSPFRALMNKAPAASLPSSPIDCPLAAALNMSRPGETSAQQHGLFSSLPPPMKKQQSPTSGSAPPADPPSPTPRTMRVIFDKSWPASFLRARMIRGIGYADSRVTDDKGLLWFDLARGMVDIRVKIPGLHAYDEFYERMLSKGIEIYDFSHHVSYDFDSQSFDPAYRVTEVSLTYKPTWTPLVQEVAPAVGGPPLLAPAGGGSNISVTATGTTSEAAVVSSCTSAAFLAPHKQKLSRDDGPAKILHQLLQSRTSQGTGSETQTTLRGFSNTLEAQLEDSILCAFGSPFLSIREDERIWKTPKIEKRFQRWALLVGAAVLTDEGVESWASSLALFEYLQFGLVFFFEDLGAWMDGERGSLVERASHAGGRRARDSPERSRFSRSRAPSRSPTRFASAFSRARSSTLNTGAGNRGKTSKRFGDDIIKKAEAFVTQVRKKAARRALAQLEQVQRQVVAQRHQHQGGGGALAVEDGTPPATGKGAGGAGTTTTSTNTNRVGSESANTSFASGPDHLHKLLQSLDGKHPHTAHTDIFSFLQVVAASTLRAFAKGRLYRQALKKYHHVIDPAVKVLKTWGRVCELFLRFRSEVEKKAFRRQDLYQVVLAGEF